MKVTCDAESLSNARLSIAVRGKEKEECQYESDFIKIEETKFISSSS